MAGDFRTHIDGLEIRQALSLCQRLQASRRFRDRWGVFFVEGVRNFLSALDNNWDVEAILYSDRLLISGIGRSKVRSMRRGGVVTFKLSPEEFRTVSQAKNASGIAAIVRQQRCVLGAFNRGSHTCLLAADSIESSGNLGTLLRTSAAIGGTGLVVLGPSIDPYCPVLVRSSMGSLFRQKVYWATHSELRSWARQNNVQVIGATPTALTNHFAFSFKRPCIIALGDERRGLSPQLEELCTALVRIPMVPTVDSLNVSVAGSLLLYEVARRDYAGDVQQTN